MPLLTIAVAIPVFSPKQSDRLAATLYSPPETWTSNDRALRNGTVPGSSRCTSAPSERKSSSQSSRRMFKPLMPCPRLVPRSESVGDVDVHLQRLLVLQQLHHLPVAAEP